jgi:methyl-accepting chemotaxis protein
MAVIQENRVMRWNIRLRTKLLSAFISISLIALTVGYIGWRSNAQLIEEIISINNHHEHGVGLSRVKDGLMEIAASERMLLNPWMTREQKHQEWTNLDNALMRIEEGLRRYEVFPQPEEEMKLYRQFLQNLKVWKKHHEEFLRIYREYEKLDIQNPWKIQSELANQGGNESAQKKVTDNAVLLLNELNTQLNSRNNMSFASLEQSLTAILESDEKSEEESKRSADRIVKQTTSWLLSAMILGPLVAICAGVMLSRSLSKPISGAVNSMVVTAAEMATTVEQYERVTAQQGAAVNETTATMDELEASFRQSAEQAEVAVTRARQALTLTEEGTSAVKQTLGGMSSLKGKVEAIAEQILRLSDQTSQIGNITNLVSELANQTNLLALNAAVEAARAGEHGKGFAVVAAEIRKLADQSKKSAERINTLVLDIQNATNATVMATEEGTKTVEAGTYLAHRTAEVFDGLAAAITNVFESSQQTLLNVKQQVAAVRQVVEAMDAINNGSKETTSGITQTRIDVQHLNGAAQSLQIIV